MGRRESMRSCAVGLLLCVAVVYVTSVPLEDPLRMADDMLKHLDIDDKQDRAEEADLGEGDEANSQSLDAGEDERRQPLGKASRNKKMPSTKDPLDQKTGKRKLKAKCRDAIQPAACKHKKMLCDDRVHKNMVRKQCAATCGVCSRKVSTRRHPKDKTSFCLVNKKKCRKSKTIRNQCPQTCGVRNRSGRGL